MIPLIVLFVSLLVFRGLGVRLILYKYTGLTRHNYLHKNRRN